MKIFKSELALILALFVALTYTTSANKSLEEISDKVIRFHVLANSNDEYDQELKIEVKNEIFSLISDLTEECLTNEQAHAIINANIEVINNVSKEIISRLGYNYNVETTLQNEFYPQKDYEQFSLPAGYYEGLQIKIGEAVGENWWCVLFPPLCNQTAFDTKNLTDDDLDFITKSDYEFRFKLIDTLSNIKYKINS